MGLPAAKPVCELQYGDIMMLKMPLAPLVAVFRIVARILRLLMRHCGALVSAFYWTAGSPRECETP